MTVRLKIADLCIEVESPFPLKAGIESNPFVYTGTDTPECFLIYKEITEIAFPARESLYSDANHLYFRDDNVVYLTRSAGSKPYAKVTMTKDDPYSMICEYTPGSESELMFVKNILSVFGLESILLRYQALILHASFINYQGNGILFSGTTGAGKSTQAALWEKYENAEIINGDRAGLRKQNDMWYSYGLPIAGSSGIYNNCKVPLRCIIFPIKADANSVRKASAAEAYRYLYPEVMMHRWDPVFENEASLLLMNVISEIPVYFMSCLPDRGAVDALKSYLTQEGVIR